jgi:hypothetical protein
MGDLRDRQGSFGLVRFLTLSVGLGVAGCDDGSSSHAGETPPALEELQAEIFTPSCTLSSCHSTVFHAGELVLEEGQSYEQLTQGAVFQTAAADEGLARVVPGDAASSFLWQKLQPGLDAKYGTLMPQGSVDGLPDDKLALVEGWIEAGAAND